jgi:shikimate dehydrogenase
MRIFGLIGKTLAHSFSKQYFETKFAQQAIANTEYKLFELNEIDAFENLIEEQSNLVGLNVTIPYKQSVIPFLDFLSPEAAAIGAVNCIHFASGKKSGYNTDAIGFERSLFSFLPIGKMQNDFSVFVLGSGGSSKAVQYVLRQHHIPFYLVSRRAVADNSIEYADIVSFVSKRNLYINCTPVGMFPHVAECLPIDFSMVSANDYFFDLIYNPVLTTLLQRAQAQGAAIQNGQAMLEYQAEAAWAIWNK